MVRLLALFCAFFLGFLSYAILDRGQAVSRWLPKEERRQFDKFMADTFGHETTQLETMLSKLGSLQSSAASAAKGGKSLKTAETELAAIRQYAEELKNGGSARGEHLLQQILPIQQIIDGNKRSAASVEELDPDRQ